MTPEQREQLIKEAGLDESSDLRVKVEETLASDVKTLDGTVQETNEI